MENYIKYNVNLIRILTVNWLQVFTVAVIFLIFYNNNLNFDLHDFLFVICLSLFTTSFPGFIIFLYYLYLDCFKTIYFSSNKTDYLFRVKRFGELKEYDKRDIDYIDVCFNEVGMGIQVIWTPFKCLNIHMKNGEKIIITNLILKLDKLILNLKQKDRQINLLNRFSFLPLPK